MTTNTQFIGFVGTYTKGESEGIYSFTLDTQAGQITDIKVAAEIDSPTYLTISKDNRYLYSIVKEGELGGIAALAVSDQSEKLTQLNTQVLAGSPPCHVSIDSNTRFAFSTNYHKGEVVSYLINADGTLTPPVSVVKFEGSGPDPRQEKAHTHFAGVTPGEKFLAVVELGIDQLITYQIGQDGKLTEASRLAIRPGSGPRHLTFHPNHKFAYIMTEFSSEVIALAFNQENGIFKDIQTISTLPEVFKENNQGSAIHISSDGRFVYAGNRGHNSIAVFQVDSNTGKLEFVERVSTEGDWPRDFSLDPTEKFIVASNQNSSNLVLYARNTETGKLTLLQSDVNVPDPICIKFLHM
ncbi:lactonase family protein [Bacillus sp. EB600]|uniref:lactonase family protein n=1 Tax=Bacillus sp. EB600 TaxID=2806345 RepID=UPI00210E3A34|nr:lactonase family protein [Bacillus sp. EB600]MCQ6278869.1 lactonase family protein [Bacillus sp. EB600]